MQNRSALKITDKSKSLGRQIRTWVLRAVLLVAVLIGALVTVILNPGWFYKHDTVVGRLVVHYSEQLDTAFLSRLNGAFTLVEGSELFDPTFSMDICIGESAYPGVIKRIFGNAFAWGFYNKVVLNGKFDSEKNVHESGWNLTQLLAHEMIHCYQFNRIGLWHSNPVAGHPQWNRAGYPEFVAKADIIQPLMDLFEKQMQAEEDGNEFWITLPDATRTSREYHRSWLLVKYCLQQKGLSYRELLRDTTSQEVIQNEMLDWYQNNHNKQ
jgi:hypothetical protein